jgi:hypothetical protein
VVCIWFAGVWRRWGAGREGASGAGYANFANLGSLGSRNGSERIKSGLRQSRKVTIAREEPFITIPKVWLVGTRIGEHRMVGSYHRSSGVRNRNVERPTSRGGVDEMSRRIQVTTTDIM